jgi:hypothetical protein
MRDLATAFLISQPAEIIDRDKAESYNSIEKYGDDFGPDKQ